MIDHSDPRALHELRGNFSDAIAQNALARESRRRAQRRSMLAVSALAAVVVVLLGGLRMLGSNALSTSEAAAELSRVALGVAPPPPGQFAFQRSDIYATQRVIAGTRLARFARPGRLVRVQQKRNTWLSVSEPGRIEALESVHVGKRVARKSTSSSTRPYIGYVLGSQTLTDSELRAFAAHPERAVEAIARAAQKVPVPERAHARWRLTVEPLQAFAPVLPPEVRAALIRSLATIPGVSIATTGRDSSVDAFELNAVGIRERVEFVRSTATLVRSRTTVTRHGAGPYRNAIVGTTLYEYELLETANVTSAGDLP